MTAFGIIALAFFAMVFVLIVAIVFLKIGQTLERREIRTQYFAEPQQNFIQRIPGQEPGYVEVPMFANTERRI